MTQRHAPSNRAEHKSVARWQLSLPAQLALLIVAVTLVAATALQIYVRQQQRSAAGNQIGVYTEVLLDHLTGYENLLLATSSHLYANQTGADTGLSSGFSAGSSADTLKSFVDGLELKRNFPSVVQVGVQTSGSAQTAAELARALKLPTNAAQQHALARLVRDTLSSGNVHLSAPLGTGEQQRLLALRPCPPLSRASSCVVYAVIDVPLLLKELDTSTPLRQDRVALLVGGITLGSAPAPASKFNLFPLGDEKPLSRSLDVLGQSWTVRLPAANLPPQPAAALLIPLLVLLGALSALLTYRLVSGQTRLNSQLQQINAELLSSQTFLEQSRADFSSIFQSMENGAVFTTPGGHVRMMNRRFSTLMGLNNGDIRGRVMREVLGERLEASEQLQRPIDSAVYTGVIRKMHGARGRVFDAELSRTRVLGTHGELLGYLHVVRNVTRRLAAERRLRQQELHSRQALDGVPHLLWLSDTQGNLTYGNSRYYGCLAAKKMVDNVVKSEQAEYLALWERAYASGEAQEMDVQLKVRHKGQTKQRWFSLKIAPLRSEQGEVAEWIAVATDVHGRIKAERRARAEQQHYRQVLDGLPQVVWTNSPNWDIDFVNNRWFENHPGRARPANLADLARTIHPHDQPRFLRAVEKAKAKQQPLEIGVRTQRPPLANPAAEHMGTELPHKKHYRHIVVRAVPLKDEQGKMVEWVGTSSDVDGQVQAEQAARLLMQVSDALSQPLMGNLDEQAQAKAAQQRFQNALDIMARYLGAAAVLWFVPNQDYADIKAAAANAPKWQQLSLDGHTLLATAWVSSDNRPLNVHEKAIMRSLAEDAAQRFDNHDLAPAYTLYTQTVGMSSLLIGHDGRLSGVLTLELPQPLTPLKEQLSAQFVRRISTALDNDMLRRRVALVQRDLRRLNQTLEERVRVRTQDLKAANQELEAFSYSVSHDLRAPLRHLTGFSELLGKKLHEGSEPLPPKIERYLSVIQESGQRMSQLIDDLLDFSRTGRTEMQQRPVNLRQLAQEEWERLAPDREQQRNTVTFDLGDLPEVQGDERLLRQVFANLLGNALKYSRERAEIYISVQGERVPSGGAAKARGEVVRVTVSDNGVGFDPRYADKLFGVFQRLHSSEQFEGTGIGLANVRRIVQRHGGEVFAHSTLGEGATFGFTLPIPAAGPRPKTGPHTTAPLPLPASQPDTGPSARPTSHSAPPKGDI